MLPLPPLHPLSSPFLIRTADNATASTAGDSLSSVDNDSMKCPSQPQSQFEALKVFKKQFQMGVSEIDEVAIALALKACKDNASMESQELEKIYHGQTKDTADFGANETELACKVIFSASEGKSSTQTVPGRLYKNEEILCTKHRHIQDKKASCDKSIQGILDGRKDNEGLEGKVIKQLCDEICFQQTHTQEVQKLGSVALSLRPASGFRIKVFMQDGSFKCSCEGDKHSDSVEAKESAAAKMVSRLRTMADQILRSLS
nr:pentatricopeptide repeat-containing protein At4g32430, mitochondrial-like [Ipomoea batatas]